jgi:hypothetical protein
MSTLIGIVLLAVYVGGAYKFWTGFRRTNFSEGKLYLTLLWPAFILNRSYRDNFRRALKG